MMWDVMSASARGARHERIGEPNEDAHRTGRFGDRAIVAIADGHGSPSCPRADRGSQFAVDAIFEVLEGDLEQLSPSLGERLVESWRRRVDRDLEADPLVGKSASSDPNYLLYGTTAVGVAADADNITVLQIGDGDVLLGAKGSSTARRPIPPREMDRPGATESLCQNDAASRVLTSSIDASESSTDVVLIATDGLDNAFAEEAWHDETMTDLMGRLVDAESPEAIADLLQGWCESPAAVGGDDTTIGLLVRSRLWSGGEE